MAMYLDLANYVTNLRALGFTDDDFANGGSNRLVDAIVVWGDIGAIMARVRAAARMARAGGWAAG